MYALTVKAYVLIQVTPGKTDEILEQLVKIQGVKQASPVTGRYDIIAYVEAESIADLGRIVTRSIRAISGVLSTETAVVISS
ncbi:MAG: Lrp/AsnC family transcriptional regulator [Candidatus Methanomethylicota archaeon]|uniref:Lrp/AsnC family transcriptional regulator n=1 Tax=Thermoproteota archaeon TaxID=2056631 RepID=A0A497EXM4_9CREN|nr:MAG: Lrp/AsnC family transcriptional regulator [Candidatus Verstraetearchaeota archaeon]RLE51937.1 MAG: Lrp/AsnC family transcriptional regulator [Candidatus Verstraetearchaeota archaeon]